jgi:hypothetical protein
MRLITSWRFVMSKKIKVKAIDSFVLRGESVKAGATVSLDPLDANYLAGIGRVKRVAAKAPKKTAETPPPKKD